MNGKNCYLFFSGYYVAVKVSQILAGCQIENRVVRAPIYMRGSCNFAVLIDADEEERTMEVLRNARITLEKKEYGEKRRI